MHFNTLKEFLQNGLTQNKYAKSKGWAVSSTADRMTREMKRLLATNVIDARSIIADVSMHVDNVKRNKENWLKAIDAYERTIATPVDIKTDNRKISELTVSEFVGVMMKVMGNER
jgi:hypothetical protein